MGGSGGLIVSSIVKWTVYGKVKRDLREGVKLELIVDPTVELFNTFVAIIVLDFLLARERTRNRRG